MSLNKGHRKIHMQKNKMLCNSLHWYAPYSTPYTGSILPSLWVSVEEGEKKLVWARVSVPTLKSEHCWNTGLEAIAGKHFQFIESLYLVDAKIKNCMIPMNLQWYFKNNNVLTIFL